jgi:hypothetical protein
LEQVIEHAPKLHWHDAEFSIPGRDINPTYSVYLM